jgi:hypothetical protein
LLTAICTICSVQTQRGKQRGSYDHSSQSYVGHTYTTKQVRKLKYWRLFDCI